jgi:hypothetical protein
MRNRERRRAKLAVAVLTLCLAIAAAVFPLTFSESVVAAFLRVLEVVARLS